MTEQKTTSAPAIPMVRMAGGDEEHEPRQADGDRDPAECDCLAGGADRPFHGLGDGSPATQLLAVAAHDEQRVVDRQGEPEHRRDVEHEDAHLDALGDEEDEREAARDRQARDEQWHPGRDQRAEDEQEHDGDDRQRDELGLLEVLLGLLGGILGDRAVAGQLEGVARGRLDGSANGVDEVDGLLIGGVELDDDVGGVTGGADEAGVPGLGEADDPGHVRLGLESGERRRDRPLERGRSRIRGGRLRSEQDDDRALARTELLVQPSRHRRRFGVRVEPATGRQRRRCLAGERRARERDEDGDQGDGLAEAVDERSPAAEHREASSDAVRR